MDEKVENKVKSIVGLYNFYKHQMNTVERVGLLSMWIEASIDREEYEVAAGLQKELNNILNGEEEFHVISPSLLQKAQREELEKQIFESLNEKKEEPKKKLKFVNYWGSGTFELIRIGFKDFKFIVFNVGIEIK
jgi:hypothetical protein